jgi:hypothetical protein
MNDTPFELRRSDTVLKHGFWGRIPPEKVGFMKLPNSYLLDLTDVHLLDLFWRGH